MDVFIYVGWHNHLQGNDQKKSAVAEISNFPIPLEVLYLFVLVVSLLVASVSALILLNALDEGDRLQAWIYLGRPLRGDLLGGRCVLLAAVLSVSFSPFLSTC